MTGNGHFFVISFGIFCHNKILFLSLLFIIKFDIIKIEKAKEVLGCVIKIEKLEIVGSIK
jgi:hypothetical protein